MKTYFAKHKMNMGFMVVTLVGAMFLSGCPTIGSGSVNKKYSNIHNDYMQKNSQIALAMGQRTFEVSKTVLLKAIMAAFANKNFSVSNVDREVGFIVAEGQEFLDKGKFDATLDREGEKSFYAGIIYKPGNYVLRINGSLFEKGESTTTAKLSFSAKVNTESVKAFNWQPYNDIPSEILVLYYKDMWAEIEKSIFMQRETILN